MQKAKDSSKSWVASDQMHGDFHTEAEEGLPLYELVDDMTDQLTAAHRTQSSTLAAGHASAQRALEAGHEAIVALVARRVEAMRQVALENTMLRAQLVAISGRTKDTRDGDAADAAAGSKQQAGRDMDAALQGGFSNIMPFASTHAAAQEGVYAPSVAPPKLDVLPGMIDEGRDSLPRPSEGGLAIQHEPSISASASVQIVAARRASQERSKRDSAKSELEIASGATQSGTIRTSTSEDDDDLESLEDVEEARDGVSDLRISEPGPNFVSASSGTSDSTGTATTETVPGRRMTRFDIPMDSKASDDYNDIPSLPYDDSLGKKRTTAKRFEVARVWADDQNIVGMMHRKSKAGRNKALIKAATRAIMGSSKQITQEKRHWSMDYMVITPGSPLRTIWDVFSLLLVLYDLGSIPLVLLDPPANDFTNSMAWITRIFWTLDIPISFVTGYLNSDGSVEMQPKMILRNYIKSWFLLDVMLVSVDWAELVASGAADAAAVGRASRTFRILRMIRLMRMVRLMEILRVIQARIRSERLIIVVDIAKIMAGIAAVAHLVACCWYGLGNSGDAQTSWVKAKGINELSLEEAYFTSLHWSIAQFHGGMDEIVPQGLRERVFAVSVFLAAWMMAAAFISGLTSEMTRLHILSSHQSRQLNVLQRYLRQSNISDKLRLRVVRNAQHAISEQQRLMPEHEVELLAHVSMPLRVELHFEMFSPVLEVHPYFEKYVYECTQVVRKVCHEAMSILLMASGDVIFTAGEVPGRPKMYIVCSGALDYIPFAGQVKQVHSEMWLSEAALWTKWMHRGVLKTTVEGRLCLIDAVQFQDIVGCFDHSEFDPRRYARFYVEHLNHMLEESVDQITDLACGEEEKIALKAADQKLRSSAFGDGMKILRIASRRRSAFMDPNSSRRAIQELAMRAGHSTN